MNQCPVCTHEHRRFIEYALTEEPDLIKHLSWFYELPILVIQHHMSDCIKKVDPVEIRHVVTIVSD